MKRLLVSVWAFSFCFMIACSTSKSTVTNDEAGTLGDGDSLIVDTVLPDKDAVAGNEGTAGSDTAAHDGLSGEGEMPDAAGTDDLQHEGEMPEGGMDGMTGEDGEMPDMEHEGGEKPDKTGQDGMVKPDADMVPEVLCETGKVALSITVVHTENNQQVEGVAATVTLTPEGAATTVEPIKNICYAPDAEVAIHFTPAAGFTWSKWRGKDSAAVLGTFPDFTVKIPASGTTQLRLKAEFVKN